MKPRRRKAKIIMVSIDIEFILDQWSEKYTKERKDMGDY